MRRVRESLYPTAGAELGPAGRMGVHAIGPEPVRLHGKVRAAVKQLVNAAVQASPRARLERAVNCKLSGSLLENHASLPLRDFQTRLRC